MARCESHLSLKTSRRPGSQVAKWRFKRIIPAHLANDIRASPADFKQAFSFLRTRTAIAETLGIPEPSPRKEDLFLLETASDLLTKIGVVDPPAPRVEEKKEIFSLLK